MGRPLDYENVDELELAIASFFQRNEERPTIAGLALHLGFNSRQSLYNYEERKEFLDTIKKARLRIEEKHEQNLYGGAATGSIFWLKNKDKSRYEDSETSEDTRPQTAPSNPLKDRGNN